MASDGIAPTVDAMTRNATTPPPGQPLRVLVAGGGVAAVEALLGLRALAGDRVELTLLSPDAKLVDRPASVQVPFGLGRPRTLALDAIAQHVDADIVCDSLAGVAPERHSAVTAGDRTLDYDVLVVATGAVQHEPLPGALTFSGPASADAFRALLRDLHSGRVRSVAFVVPTGTSWTLPLYELALGAAARLRAFGVTTAQLTITTPEEAALELFGLTASHRVEELLTAAGIDFVPRSHATAVEEGEVVLLPGRHLPADRVVTLPRLTGPAVPGLPHNPDGFLETDVHGQIRRVPDVYAAGDATAFPIKQGGLAAEQADAVAEAIAARAGAPVDPLPFHPVLRGQLLIGRTQRYLEAPIHGGAGDESRFERVPLWWPPAKVAAQHLGAYLESVVGFGPRPDSAEGVPVLAAAHRTHQSSAT
jgi:sulfide:quinone oxidoreductase